MSPGSIKFETILPLWRNLQPPEKRAWFDVFVKKYRHAIIEVIDGYLARKAAKASARPLDPQPAANEPPADELPPDLWTAAQRTKANLAAMQLVADRQPGQPLDLKEYRIVAAYSGWGGLSIDKARPLFPPGLVPETFGLIHEYYTPSVIAGAIAAHVCPLLQGLVGRDGIVRALEPSVGIGRLVRAVAAPRCVLPQGDVQAIRWTTIEFSKVSSAMFTALRPDAQHFQMPFERWIRLHGSAATGTIHLILSNPPYGERGEYAREDGDGFYDEKAAYLYFMRRAADLLVPGGLIVVLIPAGFLSGASNRGARAKMLVRHHLSAAYRLPSHTTAGREFVPGANVVMDILFWRSRGGELAEVDPTDAFILEGDYFDRFPGHVLGKTEGDFAGEEDPGRRFRYKVVGDFTGLPPLEERPFCQTCQVGPIAARPVPEFQTVARTEMELPSDVPEELREALLLGRRVGRYLAALAADDERAVQLWPELHAALLAFAERDGNPWRKALLRERAEKREDPFAQQILNAFDKKGALVPALAAAPQITPKYGGRPDDVVAQAEALFRQQRSLTLVQLEAFHKKVGGTLGQPEILAALTAAEWNINGEKWDHLYPRDAYLTGNDLWDRYDRAMVRAAQGDEQARVQARRLIDAIRPAVFEDIQDINPQLGYVPLELVAGWISDTINARYGRVVLERRDGFVQVRGSNYVDSEEVGGLSPETLAFLGYYNHDPALFQVPPEKRDRNAPPISREERAENKKNLAERRIAQAAKWAESFKAWVGADEGRRKLLTDAYNRSARGRIVPAVPTEPLDIARWGAQAPRLKPHQIAGARRVLAARGGLVAFDVGVGKTYTALGILARARQEGWVRRPVIVVPGSLVWKWHDDVLCTLPDYRVAVIGSKRKRVSRGKREGIVTSETDTPKERAAKWIALQSGQLDVVILSFDALGRTRMNESAVLEYIDKVESVRRSIALRRRNLEEKAQTAKGRDKLSERERALLEHGTRAWVQEILALPEGYEYDPGVAWDELGVDMLIVDEAAAFKNLHKPQAREDGVPKFMGSGGEGSDRAWQLDFRAAQVRKNTGGAGIVLLTATPAKNSPLEFYNLIQFIDPNAFLSAGIHDPEQFIDRFLKIEYTEVLDSTFEVAKRPAVTGFKNLDDLRTIIFTYGEFRTAAEVDLKMPRPIVQTLTIKMDDAQEAKYARYVSEIERILENPSPDGPSNIILGLLARLSMVALHAALEDGYTYQTALAGGPVKRKVTLEDGSVVERTTFLPRPVYESPKLTECARRVSASQHCGHIIFCEPTVVHLWMREVLVAHGVPRERIAILNAEETAPADRTRIAREFNGLSSEPPAPGTCARPSDSKTAPKYDVVIANSVAYEGVDLQVRTCTIHHIDLPWTPADLEQRNGRAVRQGNTLDTVQIYYYFADGSSDGYRFSLIDGKAGWLGDLLKSQVRDTNNPAAQQQLTPEDILLMISRNKEKTKKLLEEKRQRQLAEARAKIAREAVRLLRQASGRFAEARRTDDAERAAKLREEGDLRLSDIERLDPEAWPWAKWMYAVRDTELLVPENGGAPVFEGLRIARPRAGDEGKFDYLEFGQVITDDGGQKIGIRAAGSPGWELVTYSDGTVSGAAIRPEHMPREDGPAWPDDDDLRTGTAIERKIGEVFRYGKFENLRWRGAADAWLEKWWSRFQAQIAEGLAESRHHEKVPVIDDEGLAIAAGAELRGATILPPTRAGWQRFVELAPASGESFTSLKDIGLSWWGRKVPQDLLSKERNLLRKLIVPRLLEDAAYRNARENADPQNARVEHDKALGRVMLDLFTEDQETHGELYKRYADDDAFRRSLQEQSFAATYPPEKKPDAGAKSGKDTAPASEPRITDEQWAQLQALFDKDARREAEPPEDVDQRVIDNLFLQRAAMGDALAIAGMGKREQAQQAQQAMNTAHRVMILRAEASVLRGRGYGASLAGAPERAFLLIGLGGQVLAVRLVAPVDKVVFAPGIEAETRARIERDAEHARRIVEELVKEENARPGSKDTEEIMLAVWRRAREAAGEPPAGDAPSAQAPAATAGGERGSGPDVERAAPRNSASMTLRIERPAQGSMRALAIRKAVRSLEEASNEYLAAVEESGEGASTFPRGVVVLPDGQEFAVSYNGRVWRGDRLMFDPTPAAHPEPPAPAPAAAPERPYEEARSAIKALNLPVKKHAYYLKQAETAIAEGKDFRPIVERARKAAAKNTTGGAVAARPAKATSGPARPRQRIIDVALETFNAEPRWRLAVLRTRPNGHVLVVFPEGQDAEAAVAAIDIDMEAIEDVRWVDSRIPPADQELILERLERALWAAFDVRQEEEGVDEGEEKTPIPSPIQHLIELMERRSLSLGARGQPVSTQYPAIARALQELATPAGNSAEELQTWLESNHLMEAGEILARSRTEPVHVNKLMQDLWDSILEELEVAEVDEEGSTLWVPDAAIFDINNHETILERVQDGDSFALRRHRLNDSFRERPDDQGRVAVSDVKGDLMPGALVHLRGRANERVLTELYRKIRDFRHNLVHAPKVLQDVRTLLYWTAVMLDAPLCQGEVKQRAMVAFEQAKAYYDTARKQVVEGVTIDALRRMHEALRRISTAAAEIAKSCGEGQIDIAAMQSGLPVRPEDARAIQLPNAAASVWLDLSRSPDGGTVRATLAGPGAGEWAKLHPTLLGKSWSAGPGGPVVEFNYSDVLERRIRGEVGDVAVALINWGGPFIPPAAVDRLVATLARPDLAPLREQTRRHQIPPASLAVLPLDPREAEGEEPLHRYALALRLPDGRGYMFQLDNFAAVTAADLHEPANLWQWGDKDDPDTEAVLLARGLDWDGIAALLGLDPAEVRPRGRSAPRASATAHTTVDARGLGPRTRALLASVAGKTRRGA